MERQEKVLIIKAGYSELLDEERDSRKPSLGDILRVTPLLHIYKDHRVTWVTDKEAFPLLAGNPFIDRLMHLDWITGEQLKSEEFDRVINLEKVPGICALSDRIHDRRARYGFVLNRQTGRAEAYDKALDVLTVGSDFKVKKENQRTAQELLFEMVGEVWKGEEYVLGYASKSSPEFDVVLNTLVGPKWPTKFWPKSYWDRLEDMLSSSGLSVSRQDKQDRKVLEDIPAYIDWINSGKLVVSTDSLGLHLAIALKKKTIGIFGPTSPYEVHLYGRGEAIVPQGDYECMPCFAAECTRDSSCMSDIAPERVYGKVLNLIK